MILKYKEYQLQNRSAFISNFIVDFNRDSEASAEGIIWSSRMELLLGLCAQ